MLGEAATPSGAAEREPLLDEIRADLIESVSLQQQITAAEQPSANSAEQQGLAAQAAQEALAAAQSLKNTLDAAESMITGLSSERDSLASRLATLQQQHANLKQ